MDVDTSPMAIKYLAEVIIQLRDLHNMETDWEGLLVELRDKELRHVTKVCKLQRLVREWRWMGHQAEAHIQTYLVWSALSFEDKLDIDRWTVVREIAYIMQDRMFDKLLLATQSLLVSTHLRHRCQIWLGVKYLRKWCNGEKTQEKHQEMLAQLYRLSTAREYYINCEEHDMVDWFELLNLELDQLTDIQVRTAPVYSLFPNEH